jgi:small conductance mechanosensitive channel
MLNALANNTNLVNILINPTFEKVLRIILTLLIGYIVVVILRNTFKKTFDKIESKSESETRKKRINTFSNLIENAIGIIVFFIVFVIVLSQAGVNIAPILTGAGILGLAVSFGSQTLIKDLIAGFFIITENQFNVGDTVKIADSEGIVIKINLRTTILKDKKNSSIIYIPNSSITKVIVINRKVQILV